MPNTISPGPDHSLAGHIEQMRRVRREMYDAGWMRYGWPDEVGGLGGPPTLRLVVAEEVLGRNLAEPGPYSMMEVLVPTMISYARPELAAAMVPRYLRAAKRTGVRASPSPGRAVTSPR